MNLIRLLPSHHTLILPLVACHPWPATFNSLPLTIQHSHLYKLHPVIQRIIPMSIPIYLPTWLNFYSLQYTDGRREEKELGINKQMGRLKQTRIENGFHSLVDQPNSPHHVLCSRVQFLVLQQTAMEMKKLAKSYFLFCDGCLVQVNWLCRKFISWAANNLEIASRLHIYRHLLLSSICFLTIFRWNVSH